MKRAMALLRRLIRALFCSHYYVGEASMPGSCGVIVRRRCVRCKEVEYVHQAVRRKV